MQKDFPVKGRYKCERKNEKRGRRMLDQNWLIEESPQSFDDKKKKKNNVQSIVANN